MSYPRIPSLGASRGSLATRTSPSRLSPEPLTAAALRDRIVTAMDRSGIPARIVRMRSLLGVPNMTVLTYHRVSPFSVSERTPFDREVIDATPEQFEEQMTDLARNFEVLTTRELMRGLRRRKLPRRAAMVTFDDGYLDCTRVALPILLRVGIRAVFFVATDFVTHRRVYWWDRISYLISESQADQLVVSYPFPLTLPLADKPRVVRFLQRVVKNVKGLDVDMFLAHLADRLGVSWDRDIEQRFATELVMTWDDVRRLRRAGMEVQSHTRTHRPLHTLQREQLMDELLGARRVLESELDEPVRAIAYPVGRSIAKRSDLRRAVRDAGYHVGFSNASGFNRGARSVDPLDVKRVAADRSISPALFRAMLAVPQLAYVSRHNG